MNSEFLITLDKVQLNYDIPLYIVKILRRLGRNKRRKRSMNVVWYLTNVLELVNEYNIDNKDYNLLTDNEYQNILITIKKLLNQQYYGFTK